MHRICCFRYAKTIWGLTGSAFKYKSLGMNVCTIAEQQNVLHVLASGMCTSFASSGNQFGSATETEGWGVMTCLSLSGLHRKYSKMDCISALWWAALKECQSVSHSLPRLEWCNLALMHRPICDRAGCRRWLLGAAVGLTSLKSWQAPLKRRRGENRTGSQSPFPEGPSSRNAPSLCWFHLHRSSLIYWGEWE